MEKGLWYDTSGVLAFRQENIAVSGGNLAPDREEGSVQREDRYTFGAVESLFDVPGVNSYVEIRAKALHRNANVLSAIWLQSSPLTTANNPNPEMDIQETFNYDGMVSTLHTWAIDPASPAPTAPEDYIHDQTPRMNSMPGWTSVRTSMSMGWNEAMGDFASISTENWLGTSCRQSRHS